MSLGEVLREVVDRADRPDPGPERAPEVGAQASPTEPSRPPRAGIDLRFVEVVFREADKPDLWIKTAAGMTPTPRERYPVSLREGDPLEYASLKAEALASAARSQGEQPPPTVERFIRLRAGGICQVPGCGARGEHIHHLNPRALGGTHHPDRCRLLCARHHALTHTGLLVEDEADPGSWRWLSPGTAPTRSWADVEVQARRAAATANRVRPEP